MNHPEIEELLSAWVDGELTPAQQEVVDLHLAGCADCQRALAEFRLTRQQLALLADPIVATTWQPNVVQRVTVRIRRRRRWLGLGRRLALDAVGALAVVLIVAAAVWLLPRMNLSSDDTISGVAPSRTARQPTPTALLLSTLVSPTPANVTDITLAAPKPTFMALQAPDDRFTFYLLDADALQAPPASNAVLNLGYRLSAGSPNPLVVVEVVGGEQIVLDPAEAPSIFLPPGAGSGDRVRLFAATRDGTVTPAAEFILASTEGWQALDLLRSSTPAELRAQLPTPTPQVVDVSLPELPSSSVAEGPEVVLRLERVYVTPEQPVQGQPFTVTAVIRNVGDVDAARVTVWFGAYRGQDGNPTVSSSTDATIIPAGEEIELIFGRGWGGYNLIDLSRESSRLTLRASVNVIPPGGLHYSLLPEADKLDNVAEITVDFSPYQPHVSDACPPGDNLWLEPGQAQISQSYPWQEALPIVVHNDGNVEVTRVPLRVTDAEGRRFLTYARWVQPCGGTTEENAVLSTGPFTYPITVTLNPSDVPDALPESDRGDNVIVLNAGGACTGTTDLWLTADDVAFEGDDLLVTVHLSGSSPPRSFWLRVYHTADGSVIASQQVSNLASWPCDEPKTMRFEGALAGLNGGVLMVQIYTEPSRIESVYPQLNNTASVPLP